MIRISAVTLAAALFLGGCATPPRAYDSSTSHALNVAKAAGLSKAEDYPADRVPGAGISGLLDITTSALSFESANGLNLAMGDALGLGLLSFAFSPPAQTDRNAILAWIPEEQAKDTDEAALVLPKLVLDAIETTLKAEGIAYHIDMGIQSQGLWGMAMSCPIRTPWTSRSFSRKSRAPTFPARSIGQIGRSPREPAPNGC